MFQNKVAIVTGAGQGIGYEMCKELAEAGAYVFLNDVDASLAEQAVSRINEATPDRCIAFSGDASDNAFITKMVGAAVSKFGRLDIVIANAGITLFGDFFTYSLESFYRVMQVNLGGTFFSCTGRGQPDEKAGHGWLIIIYILCYRAPGA